MAKTENININLEIVYEFHPKPEYTRIHWMYFKSSGKTHDECKEKAKKHYESQIRSLGWGKITTLKEIRPIGRTDDPFPRKTNTDLSNSRPVGKPSGGKSRKTTTRRRKS